MERTNHGKGSALTMGLASMHVCVLLDFVEDYILELMVSMCVFCWNLLKDYILIICWN
jgi:hypothetical protein